MSEQRTLLFALPEGRPNPYRDASDWRTVFVTAGIGETAVWNHLRVVPVQHLLWIIAGVPQSNTWIDANLDAIAGCVADTCVGPARLETAYRHVGVRAGQGRLWAYRIPSLVVGKGGGDDWKAHTAPVLSPEVTLTLARKIEAGVRRELLTWGALPIALGHDKPFFIVTHPGRGMIVPGIHADRSGHGKAVNVLLRRQVMLLSPLRIEGNVFAGSLNSLGYGRLIRAAAPEILEPATQRALMDLPTYEEATE